MSWKKPKSSIQNIAFILFIALLLFTPLALLLIQLPTAGLFAKDDYSIRTKQISKQWISRCCGTVA
jgi:hypothetical protein